MLMILQLKKASRCSSTMNDFVPMTSSSHLGLISKYSIYARVRQCILLSYQVAKLVLRIYLWTTSFNVFRWRRMELGWRKGTASTAMPRATSWCALVASLCLVWPVPVRFWFLAFPFCSWCLPWRFVVFALFLHHIWMRVWEKKVFRWHMSCMVSC